MLPAVLAAGFALRLGFGLAHPPQKSGQDISNDDGYVELATSVAQSGTLRLGAEPSALREPVYPILLGLMFKAFGRSYPVVLLTNCGLAVLALGWLFLGGRELFGEAVALGAVAVSALYPPFVYYAAQTVRETALLAVSAAALWTLLRALNRPSARAFVWAGLCGALCGLTNTALLLFGLVLAPLAIFWINRSRWTSAWRWSGIYTLAFVLLYSLWPLRNYLAFKTWIPGTTLSAATICYVFLIVPQELGGTAQETRILADDPVFQAAPQLPLGERDRYFRKAVLERIRLEPWRYAKLVGWRLFWDEWRLWPRQKAAGSSYRLFRWIGLLFNGWIIPLGLIGMIAARCRPRPVLCLYLFIFSIVMTYSLILTMLRYRTPIMPWLILFACFSLSRCLEAWKRWRGRNPPAMDPVRP